MLRSRLFILCVLCAAFLLGCYKSGTPHNDNSPTNGNKAASRSTNSATSTTGSSEKIGIAECDEFIAKYNACISDHVPDTQKNQYKENIDALARAWRQLSANTEKGTVAAACKRHIDQARESMKSFNCNF